MLSKSATYVHSVTSLLLGLLVYWKVTRAGSWKDKQKLAFASFSQPSEEAVPSLMKTRHVTDALNAAVEASVPD